MELDYERKFKNS